MNATSLEPDLAIFGGVSQAVPGFPSTAYLYAANRGTTPTDGTTSFTYDNQLIPFGHRDRSLPPKGMTYWAASGSPSVVGNTITWGVPVLQPGEFPIDYFLCPNGLVPFGNRNTSDLLALFRPGFFK